MEVVTILHLPKIPTYAPVTQAGYMALRPLKNIYCCFLRRSTDHYDLTCICTVIDVFSSEYRVDNRFAHLKKLIQITQTKNIAIGASMSNCPVIFITTYLNFILDFILLATQCVSSLSLLCDLLTAVSRSRMPPSSRSDGTLTLEEQLLYDGNIPVHLNI